MAAPKAFTQQEADRIKATIKYDPETGQFERFDLLTKEWGKLNIKPNRHGYVQIGFLIDNKFHSFLAHRVAYLLSTGELDFPFLDHINGIRSDNRLENLRTATLSQNQGNRRELGVRLRKDTNRWQAFVKINGKKRHLGMYKDKEQAISAYRKAHAEYHKEFSPYYEELAA